MGYALPAVGTDGDEKGLAQERYWYKPLDDGGRQRSGIAKPFVNVARDAFGDR